MLFCLAIIFTCCGERKTPQNEATPGTDHRLKLVTEIKLEIPEPSGLCLGIDKKSLYVVSDENQRLYHIDLNGEILESAHVDGIDLEGVCVLTGKRIGIVTERDRGIIILDSSFNIITRKNFHFEGDLNLGFEGLAYDFISKHYFIVNEKNPGKLIELDKDLEISKETKLTFASDYSGLSYDNEKNELWILSDESKLIAKCDRNGYLLEKYYVNINQMEGLAIDFTIKRLYIVSDITEKLYVFDLVESAKLK